MRKQKAIKHPKLKASVGRAYAAVKKLRLPVLMLAAIFLTVFVIGSGAIPGGSASEVIQTSMDTSRFAAGIPSVQPTQELPLAVETAAVHEPTSAPTLEEGVTLAVGDSDAMIPEIITMLASLGYIESDEPTEYFNEPMENAVKLFQRSNNMNQTGEVDSLMLNVLYSGNPSEYVIEHGNSGEDVKMVQERLTDLGYYEEKVNGYYGTSTRSAIEDFQITNDLDVNGVVDTDTFSALFSYDAIACVEPVPSVTEEAPEVFAEPEQPEPIEQPEQMEQPEQLEQPEQPVESDSSEQSDVSKTMLPSFMPKPTPEPTAVPTSEPFANYNATGYTNVDYVNFRSSPSTYSAIIGVLTYGTQIRIIARTSQWYRVMYAGHFGYIAVPYVTLDSVPRPTPETTPGENPTTVPTAAPTSVPTPTPTTNPTAAPTATPAPNPTQEPFVDFVSDGYINKPYVNFRSQPSTESPIILVLTYGTQVQVIAKTSEWYRVQYSGYTGYVASPYITLGVLATATPAPTAVPAPTPTPQPTGAPTPSVTADPFTPYNAQGYVNVGYVNFRTGPSTDYSVISQLTYGTVVEVLATNGQWYRARHNGTVGYVFARYVTIGTPPTSTPQPTQAPSNGNVENFVSVLRAQLGKPYVGGTQGPNTFDCSGYVYYCLKLCGVNIGRLTAAGYSAYTGWTRVDSFSSLRRGDLMFFYSNDFSRINHVAVYLGNGQLIHASFSAGEVVISNANSNWYQNHFYCGRRVFEN